jgi:anti-anti-sigma regulatory factor
LNSLLIHLSGYLSAEMGSELYLKTKEMSQNPTLFCLDCHQLSSIDSVGAEYFKKISTRVQGTASKVALAGCSTSLRSELSSFAIENLFPIFATEEEAKLYLESQSIPTEPANESNQTVAEQKTVSEELPIARSIHCPVCNQMLRFQDAGDYSCPSCHNKFAVSKRGWTSLYERLV